MKPAAPLVAFLICAAVGAKARAAGADEWQAALRLGIGAVNVDGRRPWGESGGLDVEHGLTDAWALRASIDGSSHSVSKNAAAGLPGGGVHTDAVLVGITYTIDVLRLVPYADLELGIAQIGGAVTAPITMFASELGLGGDYYVTRRLRAGLSFQYLYRPQDLISNPEGLGNAPFMFSMTGRLSWVF